VLLTLAFAVTACSKPAAYKYTPEEKALMQQSVFEYDAENPPTPEDPETPVNPEAPVTPVCVGNNPDAAGCRPIHLSFKTMCTGSFVQYGASFAESGDLKLAFVDQLGQSHCEIPLPKTDRVDQVINKVISIAPLAVSCPQITAGDYRMFVVPIEKTPPYNERSKQALLGNRGDQNGTMISSAVAGVPVKIEGSANQLTLNLLGQQLWMLLGKPGKHATPEINELVEGRCDATKSPLLIQLSGDHSYSPLRFTPPSQGIYFDIFGRENNYQQTQISWFADQNVARSNGFLALPNARGEVNGIDQLFGNNTTGPDGKFSANGYEALRKYDSRKDGKIDRADRVFSKLRLWLDLDLNGKASSNELYSLDTFGIERLSLSYDSDYNESDKYGNQILMKSIVDARNGVKHLMYDVWFIVSGLE
jgi:hypothetical protein